MDDQWTTTSADAVAIGDLVQHPNGQEFVVARVEERFVGRDEMIAFIEDTPARWCKYVVPVATELQVRRA